MGWGWGGGGGEGAGGGLALASTRTKVSEGQLVGRCYSNQDQGKGKPHAVRWCVNEGRQGRRWGREPGLGRCGGGGGRWRGNLIFLALL